jgi:hypothetical protein
MVGDGVTTCDLPKYETQLTLSQPGTTVQEFDANAFKDMLYSTGAIPSTIPPDNVYVSATEGGGATRRRLLAHDDDQHHHGLNSLADSSRRHLLQSSSDLQIKVSIYSQSQVCTVFLFCIKPEQMNSNLSKYTKHHSQHFLIMLKKVSKIHKRIPNIWGRGPLKSLSRVVEFGLSM